MHNIKLIRKNTNFFTKKIKERNASLNINQLLDLDNKNRDLIQKKKNLNMKKK